MRFPEAFAPHAGLAMILFRKDQTEGVTVVRPQLSDTCMLHCKHIIRPLKQPSPRRRLHSCEELQRSRKPSRDLQSTQRDANYLSTTSICISFTIAVPVPTAKRTANNVLPINASFLYAQRDRNARTAKRDLEFRHEKHDRIV
jgi:hypothetical protein